MSFDYLKAIRKPFTDFNKLIIGVLFLLIPIVNIITAFFVKGYRLEAARDYNKKLPMWNNFGKLFLRGLLSWIVGIIYMIPAVILLGFSIGKVMYNVILQYGLNQGLSTNNPLSDSVIQSFLLSNTGLIPIFLIALILMVIAAYVTPIAIMMYIQKYKFEDAFKLKKVFKKAFTGQYFIAILAILLYGLIVALIADALQMGIALISVQFLAIALTLIVTSLAAYILSITSYTIYGEVYSKLK
jgi:hypothetical protein